MSAPAPGAAPPVGAPARARVSPLLLAMVAEGFLSRLSFGLVSFALPLYAYHLGMPLSAVGVLTTVNVTAGLAFKPVMGWLADRVGHKRGLTGAVALRSVVTLLCAVAGSAWQLYLIRAVHGVANAMRDPTVGALIAEDGGEKAVASTFAWYHTAKQLAGSIGKAAAGIILALTASNFSMVFAIAFALSLLPLATIVRFVKHVPPCPRPRVLPPAAAPTETEGHGHPEAATSPAGTRAGSILPFVGFGFLVSGVSDMLQNLFPILATQYAGLSEAQAGFVYVASTVVLIGAGPAFGWLSDNVSRKLVLSVRSVANICSSLLYIAAPTFAGMAIGKITDDAGKAAYRPAWGSIMAHVSSFDRARRAQLISWMTMGEDLGSALAPMLAGFVWSLWGIPAMLCVRAGCALFTEIVAWRLPSPDGDHREHRGDRGHRGISLLRRRRAAAGFVTEPCERTA